MIRMLVARMSLLGLKVPTADKVQLSGEIAHHHSVDAPPLTPEQRLAAANQLRELVGEVATKHAESILAVREREQREAKLLVDADTRVAEEVEQQVGV